MQGQVVTLTLSYALLVVHNLAQRCLDELEATRDEVVLDDVAYLLASRPGPKYAVVGDDGFPKVAGGLVTTQPGTAVTFLLHTPEAGPVMRTTTKAAKDLIASALEHVHRVETQSLYGDRRTQVWFSRMGLKHEGVRRRAGKHGEDVHVYARIKEG